MEQTTLFAIVLGLSTSLLWGVGNFFSAKATKLLGAITAVFYSNLASLMVFGLYYLLFWPSNASLSWAGITYSAAGGALVYVAMMVFFKALRAGPVSSVAPISSTYPMVTAIIALVAFGAALSFRQLLAIAVMIVGIVASGGMFNLKRSDRRLGQGPLLAVISAVVFGLAFACLAQGVERLGWQTNIIVELIVAVSVGAVLTYLLGRSEQSFSNFGQRLSNKFIVSSSVMSMVGMVALSLGYTHDTTAGAIVTTTAACSPVFTVILALKHFEEEVKLIPLAGVALTICGIVVLSLG